MLARRVRVVLIGALAVAVSLVAGAATQTATFEVRVTIQSMCTISATSLDFGSLGGLDPISGNVDRTSTVTVTCTPQTPYWIGLNEGDVAVSTVLNRLMKHDNSPATLRYQLYKDLNRQDVWGNTQLMDAVGGVGTGGAQVHTVYGRIPTGQGQPAAGTYKSIVTATINY